MHAVPRKPLLEEDDDQPEGPPPIGQPAMFSLRLRWVGLMLACTVLWVLGYRFVQSWWEAGYAARWTILSGLGLIFLLWRLWRGLGENHRPGEEVLLPKLGWGGALTFWRGVLTCALFGFLISPQPQGGPAWLPGALFAAAALLQPLAGFLARRERLVTLLGDQQEALVGVVSLLTGTLLIVQYGQAPWWYLLVGLGHAAYLGGLVLRTRQGKPIYYLSRSPSYLALVTLEYAFLALLLAPLFSPPLTTIAASLMVLVLLFSLWKDWRAVSRVTSAPPDD